MNFPDFLKAIDRMGFGVASFNTYHLDGKHMCFILVSGKGETGTFLKREGLAADADGMLETLCNDLEEI